MQLRYADLTNSDLTGAKLTSAELGEANCKGTILNDTVGLGAKFREKWSLETEEIVVPKITRPSRTESIQLVRFCSLILSSFFILILKEMKRKGSWISRIPILGSNKEQKEPKEE